MYLEFRISKCKMNQLGVEIFKKTLPDKSAQASRFERALPLSTVFTLKKDQSTDQDQLAKGRIPGPDIRPRSLFMVRLGLFGLADLEHLGPAGWADTLGSGPLVLHDDSLRGLHFLLSSAFDTICLHAAPPIDYER